MNFLMGVWFGSVMAVTIQVMLNDEPRTLCEENLPRLERCVKQWVPQQQPQGKGTDAS